MEEAYALADSAACVLEEFVNFDLEISVIVSGNGKDVTVFPVQENVHRNNILSKTIVPARISESLADKAKSHGSANRRTTELVWNTLCGNVLDC